MPTTDPDPAARLRLADNLAAVRGRIAAAAARAGRPADAIRLVAVTKYVGTEWIRALLTLGVHEFGENRVQQLAARVAELGTTRGDLAQPGPPAAPCWHMIGSLQRNKVRQLLPDVRIVHAVESLRLAEELDRRAAALELKVDVLLEVNVSGEASKHGVSRADLPALADAVQRLPALRLRGLMTMAPLEPAAEAARPVFAGLRAALAGLQRSAPPECRELSMGMTNDYEVAIEEGATIVRIGSALYAGLA